MRRPLFTLLVLSAAAGAALAQGDAATYPAGPQGRVSAVRPAGLFAPTLSDKNQTRVVKRFDKTGVSFFLSEAGEWSKAREQEDMHAAARYAARKIVASQLEALRPEILDVWKESGVGVLSGRTHGGEVKGDGRPRPIDIDVGLRSGRPFLGTHVAGARLTLEHDLRRGRTTFSATRRIGGVGTRLELRHEGDDDEVRASVSIPVGW